MILIKNDYMVFTISWKIKGITTNHSSETKQIESKLKGRIREATSLAMTCETEGVQQLMSILRFQTFQMVRRSLCKPDTSSLEQNENNP